MILLRKIRAGALQFVLFVGTIIAILLLSFVLVSYSHSLFQKRTNVHIEVVKTVDLALHQSFLKDLEIGQFQKMDVTNEFGIEAEVSRRYWGILELRKARAAKAAFEFEKLAFVGHSEKNRPALYLRDNQRPLVLVGNTKIMGTAYLPERGVKMGNISGNSYAASQLIYGEERKSSAQLPRFSQALGRQVEQLAGSGFPLKSASVDLKKGMILKNSFKEETKFIEGDVLDLEHMVLTGNIVIRASRKIRVRASSQLSDVILLAPSIEIDDRTKGNFQAIASKTIDVGKGAVLYYPSVLLVRRKDSDNGSGQSFEPHISLDTHAEVRGIVMYLDRGEPNMYKPHVRIDEEAKVYGEVYSMQNVELKGSVYGSLVTSAFVALENGNIYQNHIYNGTIQSEILPKEYAGITYENTTVNQVAKWLY